MLPQTVNPTYFFSLHSFALFNLSSAFFSCVAVTTYMEWTDLPLSGCLILSPRFISQYFLAWMQIAVVKQVLVFFLFFPSQTKSHFSGPRSSLGWGCPNHPLQWLYLTGRELLVEWLGAFSCPTEPGLINSAIELWRLNCSPLRVWLGMSPDSPRWHCPTGRAKDRICTCDYHCYQLHQPGLKRKDKTK